MSELDKLRELLDEAGVSYLNHRSDVTIGYYTDDPHGVIEAMDHSLQVTGLTAEQVIKALGAGTCRMRLAYEEEDADGFIWPDHYECDSCGAKVNGIMPYYDTEIQPHFCPNCGRKVVR